MTYLLLLIVFSLVGTDAQTALLRIGTPNPPLNPVAEGDTGGSSFPCQGHGCGCKDADDCINHCCCSSTPIPDVPAQPGVSYLAKTLHCRGVHTDSPTGRLTQYEPPMVKIIANPLADTGTPLPQEARKPTEPPLTPPYKPPKISTPS